MGFRVIKLREGDPRLIPGFIALVGYNSKKKPTASTIVQEDELRDAVISVFEANNETKTVIAYHLTPDNEAHQTFRREDLNFSQNYKTPAKTTPIVDYEDRGTDTFFFGNDTGRAVHPHEHEGRRTRGYRD